MNARLRWLSWWWGRSPPHAVFDFILLCITWQWRCRDSMHHLFSSDETEWQHTARQPQLGDSPPATHTIDWTQIRHCLTRWRRKGAHIVAFRSARLTWYAQLWNLQNDSEGDASHSAENLEFLHIYSEGTVCRLGRVLCFPMQEQGSSKPVFEDNHSIETGNC